MAKYRKVDVQLWNDGKFSSLSDAGKLLFLFILTHPHMTAIGAMRATIPGIAAELGWGEKKMESILSKDFRKTFERLSRDDSEGIPDGGWAMLEMREKSCFVWLPKFLKYNQPESPNVVRGWVKSIDLLPECSLKVELIKQVIKYIDTLPKSFNKAGEGFRKASERLPKGFGLSGTGTGTGTGERDATPPDPPKKEKAKVKTSAPDSFPVTDQMRKYAKSKNLHKDLNVLTEAFLTHHRAKGTKWVSWYAAWQKWVQNEIKYHGQGSASQPESLQQITSDEELSKMVGRA